MDRTRKATREGNEVTLQHKSREDASLTDEWVEECLANLQTLIEQQKQTPTGDAEFKERINALGECTRIEGETSFDFHNRLHRWHTREIPQTRIPLHPPRQK
jgi:hypothetical protein